MKPQELLAWSQVGLQLITILGVPIAQVVAFFKAQGVGDADLDLLQSHWLTLQAQIENRLRQLKG